MYKKLSWCFGNIEVVFKETLDCKESFLIKALNWTTLENFFEEHFTQCCGKLIDKTGNAEVIIAYDCTICVKYLCNLKSRLSLLKASCKILDACNRCADADNTVCVELARKCVWNRACKLFKVTALCVGFNFLNKCNFNLVNVYNKVLWLVREKILNYIISGNICFCLLYTSPSPRDA